MALAVGTRIGPYEILAPLGSGGMGEVYKACDTRLNRDVAAKILPPVVASNPERRARFEKEAKAASALNHPGILTVFDIGEEDGTVYMVTEFIDGLTLRQQRPESLRRQLDIAAQVAEALAVAHRSGITHRDLKPENIMITARDGRAKILDFGLARYTASSEQETLSAGPETEPGVIMGTVGYMSPEQARGRTVDHRSDIFSLGAVLHELFGGERAFEGDTFADTIMSILAKDPPELPSTVPAGVRQIVERCLEKEPDRRFQSAQDLAFALRALSGSSSTVQEVPELAISQAPLKRKHVWWPTMAASLLALVFALAFWRLATEPQQPDATRYRFRPFATEEYPENSPVWSPDGKSIAYHTRPGTESQLVVKSLDGSAPVVVSRSRTAIANISWTPDASRLYYTVGGNAGRIFSVFRAGGEPVAVGDGVAFAAALSPDGHTLAALMREGTEGQIQRVLTLKSPPESQGQRFDVFQGGLVVNRLTWSPDGSKILISVQGRPPELRLFDVRTGTSRLIAEKPIGLNVSPAWLDNQHILVAWPEEETGRSNLWMLDTETGARKLLLAQAEANAMPAVSVAGTIAYVTNLGQLDIVELPLDGAPPKPLYATRQDELSVAWSPVAPEFAYVSQNQIRLRKRDGSLDRAIVTGEHFPPLTDFLSPSFSPDGSRIVYVTWVNGQPPFKGWISPVSGGAPTPLGSFEGSVYGPSWSPDARWIAFNYSLDGKSIGLVKVAVGASGNPQSLAKGSCGFAPSWSPDSSKLLCGQAEGLAIIPADGGQPKILGNEYERLGAWSRDMRYVYTFRLSDGRRQLVRLDLTSGQFQPIVEMPNDWVPSNRISPTLLLSLSYDGKSLALPVARPSGDIWLLDGFAPPPSLWQRLWRK